MSASDSGNPRVLGVIPARGASKRLPRKNVLPIAGHPLIAHTIMAAAKATTFTDWLVSSDDPEIIEVATRYGAPVPFVRPAELAGDYVRNNQTIAHALAFMEQRAGTQYDIVVLLQPTCPIRSPAHIDEAVTRLWASDLDTAASLKGPFNKPHPNLKAIRNGVLEPLCEHVAKTGGEKFYLYNASIYAARRDFFMRENEMFSDRQVPILMDKFHSADVDDLADLMVAETYLRYLAEKGSSS